MGKLFKCPSTECQLYFPNSLEYNTYSLKKHSNSFYKNIVDA